jgi:hypothetical protein
VTGALQGRLGPHWAGRLPVVAASSVLVLVVGGLASELGVGAAALLMGLVVAALVASDELRRDVENDADRAVP